MAKMNPWMPERDPKILRRVGKTGEEVSELSKVCFRISIQGFDGVDPETGQPNRDALEEEVADVMAQCETTIAMLNLNRQFIADRMARKIANMIEWEDLVKDLA